MPALDFGPARRSRRPSLTPLVDVVFLLLVFFMLAARAAADRALPVVTPAPTGGEGYEGAPRIVAVAPEGLALNGTPVTLDALGPRLAALMPEPDAVVVVQPRDGVRLQDVVVVIDHLAAAGLGTVVLAE